MASQGEKQGPPREEDKSEAVRVSGGAEGHPSRTQVYDSRDESFSADVLQRAKTEQRQLPHQQWVHHGRKIHRAGTGLAPRDRDHLGIDQVLLVLEREDHLFVELGLELQLAVTNVHRCCGKAR